MTTAFVLTGGGSLGAVQVGMLQALAAHGIRPDLLVGTSAGAMNAAWVAAHGMSRDSLAELAELWAELRRTDVFPIDVRRILRGLLGRSPGVVSSSRLRHLVDSGAGIRELEEARVPVHLVATDLLSGCNVTISSGSLTTGVLASSAIPGIFAPVRREGRHLVDGGVGHRTGVTQAVELGATEVHVLPTGSPCALARPPRSAIGTAVHALSILLEQRLADEVAAMSGTATIKALPPLCPLSVSAADFSHGAELVDRGRHAALEWIAQGGLEAPAPARFLGTHSHRRPPRAA